MIQRYRILETDIEMLAAALSKAHVYVAFDDEEAGYKYVVAHGGQLEMYSPDFVRIAGVYYSRKTYEFRVHLW